MSGYEVSLFVFLLFIVAGILILNPYLPEDVKFFDIIDKDYDILGIFTFSFYEIVSPIPFFTPIISIIGIMALYIVYRLIRGGG